MITSIRRFVVCLSWIGNQVLLHNIQWPHDPFIESTCIATCRSLAPVVFSDIDVAFSMSRCDIPPSQACVLPSMSGMFLLFELIRTVCNWLYICISMSLMTTALYILHLCSLFKLYHEWLHTPAPPLVKSLPDVLSRMVRPASYGRGDDNPPSLEFMAGMIQQFDVESRLHKESWLNSCVPIWIINQPQWLCKTLRVATMSSTSAQLSPLMLMNGSVTSLSSWSLLMYPLPTMSPSRLITRKVPATRWWNSHMRSLPIGTTIIWSELQAAFRGSMLNHHG